MEITRDELRKLNAELGEIKQENAALHKKNAEHIGALDMWEARVIELDAQIAELLDAGCVSANDMVVELKAQRDELEKRNAQLTTERDEARAAAGVAIMNLTNLMEAPLIRTVDELPDIADDGEAVLFAGQLFVMSEGYWRNTNDSVMGKIAELTELITGEKR